MNDGEGVLQLIKSAFDHDGAMRQGKAAALVAAPAATSRAEAAAAAAGLLQHPQQSLCVTLLQGHTQRLLWVLQQASSSRRPALLHPYDTGLHCCKRTSYSST